MKQPLVFISYSHQNEQEKEKLLSHLGVLQREGVINYWNDDRIGAGEAWEPQISQAMEQSSVAILLISAEFLNSAFITGKEVPKLLERRKGEGLKIFPLIAKACAWRQVEWLSQMNVRPKNGKPIWSDGGSHVDDDLAAIAEEVGQLVKEIVESYEQPKPSVTGQLEPVKGDPVSKGLLALGELMEDDKVREAVMAFRIHFQDACLQIDVLGDYKDVHDLLHTLQFHCFDRVIDEKKNFPDEEALVNLADHELTLRSIIDDLSEVVNRRTFPAQETAWIQESLEPALKCLHEAIETSNQAPLTRAIWLLNRVLAIQPSRINTQLNAAARALRLPKLVEAMRTVLVRLRGLKLNVERVQQFELGVESFDNLSDSLSTLIRNHDEWQSADSELRRIEANLLQHLDELEYSWPHLKAVIKPLCSASSGTWARNLETDGEKLEQAIITGDFVRIKTYFRRYRRQAGERFYKIDTNLKRQCDELRKVGDPLASVLRVIE